MPYPYLMDLRIARESGYDGVARIDGKLIRSVDVCDAIGPPGALSGPDQRGRRVWRSAGYSCCSTRPKRRWPDIRPEDKAAVLAVLDRAELTGINGVEATSLEREWADRLGVAHAVLFNTGTAAIHAALYAARRSKRG